MDALAEVWTFDLTGGPPDRKVSGETSEDGSNTGGRERRNSNVFRPGAQYEVEGTTID